MAIVEKLFKTNLDRLNPDERVAVIAILSRMFTVVVLLILPTVNMMMEFVRTHVIPKYFMDFFLGTLFGINASTLIMHSLSSGQHFPVPQTMMYMILYYEILTNGSWFVYYFVLSLSVFSALRVMDDVSILFPARRVILIASFLRYLEELCMFGFLGWSFFTWENRDLTKFIVLPMTVVVSYMYSDNLQVNDIMPGVSRKNTTIPAIHKTLTSPTFAFAYVEDKKPQHQDID